jgi:hypothetical protein
MTLATASHSSLHGRCFAALQSRCADSTISHREADAYLDLYAPVYDALHSALCTRQQLLDAITTAPTAEALRTSLNSYVTA